MKVIPISVRRRDPHCTGDVRCLSCGHDWIAVWPDGVDWLECPVCRLQMGHSCGPTTPEVRWWCGCGNNLFFINPDGAHCPNCGKRQEW